MTKLDVSMSEQSSQAPFSRAPLCESLASSLRGKFLVFDGPDGCGKTTQIRRFVESAEAASVPTCYVREPGGTEIGEEIREVLLKHRDTPCSLRCEMLLFMASRAELMHTRIRPALERNELVVADRFVSSTYAYQGSGGRISTEEIDAVARVVLDDRSPDAVVIFDVDVETAATRTRGSRHPLDEPMLFEDSVERRSQGFFERVRQGYLELAEQHPQTHMVIDASRSCSDVYDAVITELENKFAAS